MMESGNVDFSVSVDTETPDTSRNSNRGLRNARLRARRQQERQQQREQRLQTRRVSHRLVRQRQSADQRQQTPESQMLGEHGGIWRIGNTRRQFRL